MTRYASNDVPVTDEELGRPVTQPEINEAVGRHAVAFDRDDLLDVLYDHMDDILRHLSSGDNGYVGDVINDARRKTIARRASMELYGKPDVIKASEVTS